MSDIRSGTNEKVAGPAKVLPGLSGRSCASRQHCRFSSLVKMASV